MSHAATIKTESQRVQRRLLTLMDQPDEWLYELVYERGTEWLAKHYGFDPRLESGLAGHSLFWAWWKSVWSSQDMEFEARLRVNNVGMATYSVGESGGFLGFQNPDDLRAHYLARHQVQNVKVFLPGVVLDLVKKDMREKDNQQMTATAQKHIQRLLNQAL